MPNLFKTFRDLHVPGSPLVLPNAWDPGSAKLIAATDAPAIATTSAGMCWALGLPDGGAIDASECVSVATPIIDAVSCPVSVDIENGYSNDPSLVAHLIGDLSRAGAVGINIEDSRDGTLRDGEEFAAFLGAVIQAFGDEAESVFINARIDAYLLQSDPATESVVARAQKYVDAGADGIFLPGLDDLSALEEITSRLDAPVNVMAPAGGHSVRDFANAGAARISTGPWLTQVAFGAVRQALHGLDAGEFNSSLPAVNFAVLNGLMADIAQPS